MNTLKRSILILGFLGLLTTSVFAEKQKKLILLNGNSWVLAEDLHAKVLEELPFSGYGIVGNTFTQLVMSPKAEHSMTLDDVKIELNKLVETDKWKFKKRSESFLKIRLDFPGDFWSKEGKKHWSNTKDKFVIVAKAAKDLGYKGIILDDEAYPGKPGKGEVIIKYAEYARYMVNYKFPKNVNGSYKKDYLCEFRGEDNNTSNCGYRNNNHSFKDHMEVLTSLFKDIMIAMTEPDVFPDITVIVLHGPSKAHPNTNIDGERLINSRPESYKEQEFLGAMFLGLKQGLNGKASLHEMGEFYRYESEEDFEGAYNRRKFEIANEQNNIDLDPSYQWLIPESDRGDSWSDNVSVDFMVSNYSLENWHGYNISGKCYPDAVKTRLNNALKRSDEYVIFYSKPFPKEGVSVNCLGAGGIEEDQYWRKSDHSVSREWIEMVSDVMKLYHSDLKVSSISAKNITNKTALIAWDVSTVAMGQVEYGETADYGMFSKKETSFKYDHHEQLLRKLKSGTTYHYRVISIDKKGNEVVSEDKTFATLAAENVISLESDEGVNDSVAFRAVKYYKIHVPAGRKITAQIDGLTADADLYMKIGSKAQINSYDCRSTHGGTSTDSCSLELKKATFVYITVYGYKAADYQIMAKIEKASVVKKINSNQVVKSYVKKGTVKHYKIYVSAGKKLKVSLKKLSANANLRVQIGSKATLQSYVCKSTRGGKKKERCSTKRLKHNAFVYIAVFGKQSAKYRLKAKIK